MNQKCRQICWTISDSLACNFASSLHSCWSPSNASLSLLHLIQDDFVRFHECSGPGERQVRLEHLLQIQPGYSEIWNRSVRFRPDHYLWRVQLLKVANCDSQGPWLTSYNRVHSSNSFRLMSIQQSIHLFRMNPFPSTSLSHFYAILAGTMSSSSLHSLVIGVHCQKQVLHFGIDAYHSIPWAPYDQAMSIWRIWITRAVD